MKVTNDLEFFLICYTISQIGTNIYGSGLHMKNVQTGWLEKHWNVSPVNPEIQMRADILNSIHLDGSVIMWLSQLSRSQFASLSSRSVSFVPLNPYTNHFLIYM